MVCSVCIRPRRMRHRSAAIILLSLLIQFISTSQNTAHPVKFDLRWTSGDLIEVAATSEDSRPLLVKLVEYPDTGYARNQSFVATRIGIDARTNIYPDDSLRLVLYKESELGRNAFPDRVALACSTMVFASTFPNQVIIDTGSTKSLEMQEPYNLLAMSRNRAYCMKVWYYYRGFEPESAIVSTLRLIRYPHGGRMLSYLEKERGYILSAQDTKDTTEDPPDISALDSIRVLLLKDSSASMMRIELADGTIANADSIVAVSFWPPWPTFRVALEGTEAGFAETPWLPVTPNVEGGTNFFWLRNFDLIERAGRVRIKYQRRNTSEPQMEQAGVVLERDALEIQAGSVFGLSQLDKPVGRAEYSLMGTSIWSRWISGMASGRYTAGRVPIQGDSAIVRRILEGSLQVRFSPKGDRSKPSRIDVTGTVYARSKSLGDSLSARFFVGVGLGFRIAVPVFNEKRMAKDFGRPSGELLTMVTRDQFWTEQPLRLVNDFRVDMFKFAQDHVTVTLSGRLDVPLLKSGPGDARLGILFSVDASALNAMK